MRRDPRARVAVFLEGDLVVQRASVLLVDFRIEFYYALGMLIISIRTAVRYAPAEAAVSRQRCVLGIFCSRSLECALRFPMSSLQVRLAR